MDGVIGRHSKKQRRDERKRVRKSQRKPNKPVIRNDRSRRIPAAVRDAVFTRDNGRCTFKGPTGERCDSTHSLQIDHIVPFARGGTNAASNLRLLCGKHNLLEAERAYGATAIKRFHTRE